MPSSACIRMTIRTGYFFNVDSLLFSPFSEPVMLWSLVTITAVLNIVLLSRTKKIFMRSRITLLSHQVRPKEVWHKVCCEPSLDIHIDDLFF